MVSKRHPAVGEYIIKAVPMTNEEIYDEQINPLMKQIIDICKRRHIPMAAAFQVEPYDDDSQTAPMLCLSVCPGQRYQPVPTQAASAGCCDVWSIDGWVHMY